MEKIYYFSVTTIRFIRKYFFTNPLFTIVYAGTYFVDSFVVRAMFYKPNEYTDLLSKKSVLRIGDGEVHIVLGQGIGFQKANSRLAGLLKKAVLEYKEDSPYIVSINENIPEVSNKELRARGGLKLWLPMKVFYLLYCNKNARYVNASMFYYKDSFKNIVGPVLDGKTVGIISRQVTIDSFRKKIPSADVIGIQTKETDAFDEYDVIKGKIIELTQQYGKDNIVFLAACGPASKALIYECCSFAHILDIGVGLEIAYTSEDKSDMIHFG